MLDLCSCNRMWCIVYHTYTCMKHTGLSCVLLLTNSTCWQLTLKGRSVKANYVNDYVFTLAFVHGFFFTSSALDCPTAVQIYGLFLAWEWLFFFPPKDKVESRSSWNVWRRLQQNSTVITDSVFVLCADNIFKLIFLYWSMWGFVCFIWGLGFVVWFCGIFFTLWPWI